MNDSYLSIGSNLFDRFENITLCIKKIKLNNFQIIKKSSIYETEPIGNIDQNFFYNIVLHIQTTYGLIDFFKVTKEIEFEMGRKLDSRKNYPRIIDIDILTFSDTIINNINLELPHPRLHERKFVLIPWNEIDSSYIIPSFDKPVSSLLKNVKDISKVRKLNIVL